METEVEETDDGIVPVGSYRTYEEWKQEKSNWELLGHTSSYRTYEEWKHQYSQYTPQRIKKFLPYLWGMETSFSFFVISLVFLVLTVPMRNGNVVVEFIIVQKVVGSYRTYEEWKPVSFPN